MSKENKKDIEPNDKKLEDTFSITMELQRPILKNEDNIDSLNKPKKNNSKILKIAVLAIIAIISIGIIGWIATSYEAQEKATEALISDELVEVSTEDIITFKPKDTEATKGLILYQGAKVDAKSYAHLARAVSEQGYLVSILDAPLDFPMLGLNNADKVIQQNPQIETWVVGGHSLGGVVASVYASDNVNVVDGLVLMASYPMDESIKLLEIDTVSIWGSVDGVLDYEELIKRKEYLPEDSTFVEIEGANHSQFGNYGHQSGDNEALIEADEQIDITIESIIELLGRI